MNVLQKQKMEREADLLVAPVIEQLRGNRSIRLLWVPGNGVQYDTVIVRAPGRDQYVVACPEFRSSYWFRLDSDWLAPSYIAEKLRMTEADAEAMSVLLSAVGKALS